MKRRLLFLFLLFSSILYGQNNIYRSGGITQTIGAPTFTPGASGNVVAIDTVTGEWYINPNRLSGSSWISAGYRLTNISGSVPPAYTPTAHQSHFVVNAANQLYYWDGSAWQTVGGGANGDATRLKFVVVNKSGGTLNKGDVVYVSGAQGNRVAVKKALATSDTTSANTLGVMDETVLNNNEGYCVAEGIVSGLNTSAFTEGAALYLSPTTAGAFTQTKPVAPDHMVLIGYCVKSNNGSGEISVHPDNGYEIDELHNVRITTPTDGQVLTYDATNLYWKNATVADQSATNEIQTIDTFSLSGQTLRASLLNDGVAASTVTLPIVDVVAGTNVTVSKANGIATVNGLSNTVTGTGVAGRAAFWRSTSAISSDANFAWDSTNVRLNIGAPSSPTGRLNVRGGGNTSGTWTAQFHNSTGSNNALIIRDDGNIGIGTRTPLSTLVIKFQATGNKHLEFGLYNGVVTIEALDRTSGNAPLHFYTGQANSYIAFTTGNTIEKMRLQPSGSLVIGTTPDTDVTSSVLTLNSTTKGVLLPRMTTTQRNTITGPVDGLVIYNTTTNKFQGYAGGAWVDLH